jgi:hypothetical protein
MRPAKLFHVDREEAFCKRLGSVRSSSCDVQNDKFKVRRASAALIERVELSRG